MENYEVAAHLREIALLHELSGDAPYKARAFYRAADTVAELQEDIFTIAERGELLNLPGVGRSIAYVIAEFLETGASTLLSELRSSIPPTLPELLSLEGLGVKRVRKIYASLGVASLVELREACAEGRVASLPGFGAALEQAILKSIAFAEEQKGYYLLSDILPYSERVVSAISECADCFRVEPAGEFRRGFDVARELVFAAATRDADALFRFLGERIKEGADITVSGNRLISERALSPPLIIETTSPERYGALFVRLTSAKEHFESLAAFAAKKGFELRPEGIFRGERLISAESDRDVYEFLGLQFIEPELRNGDDEIELAVRRKLPKLISERDIKGVIHVHTSYSDGVNTIAELANAAKEGGYEYIGICDHSKSATYARGMSEGRLFEQIEEIDRLNSRLGDFRILKGIEADILPDGSLDMEAEALKRLDFVIASVHTHLKMKRGEMTARIVKAIENPLTSMLGHPTGRLLLTRPESEVDMEAIIETAARTNTAIELNANPYRLDIGYPYLRNALAKGVMISINPDAHAAEKFSDIRFGVISARRSGTAPQNVLNTLSAEGFLDALSKKR